MKIKTLEEYLISRERKIIINRRRRSLEHIEDCNPFDEDLHDNLFLYEYDIDNFSDEI